MYKESLEDYKEEIKYSVKNAVEEDFYDRAIKDLIKVKNLDRLLKYGKLCTENISNDILRYFRGDN